MRQLFEPALARSSDAERASLLAGAAELAAPLFAGVGGESTAGGADEDAAFAKLHGLYWLSANLADHAPLLVVIDDLHWADSGSLRWLAYLAHRIEELPVLAIVTLRPLHGDADPDLADLLVDPATLTVHPTPLTEAATAALVAERISLAALDEVAAACYEATGGNPLLLRELLAAVASRQGDADPADLVADVRRMAPEVVSRRVRLQLAKLGTEAAALARAAAVLGDDTTSIACAPDLAGLSREAAEHASVQLPGPRSSSATRRFGSRIRCYAEPSTTPCPHRSVGPRTGEPRRSSPRGTLRRSGSPVSSCSHLLAAA